MIFVRLLGCLRIVSLPTFRTAYPFGYSSLSAFPCPHFFFKRKTTIYRTVVVPHMFDCHHDAGVSDNSSNRRYVIRTACLLSSFRRENVLEVRHTARTDG
jgi:hypothetical protein